MIYKAVCARLSGPPDASGEVLGSNVELPVKPVNVTSNFYEKTYIGTAYLEIEGDEIIAYVNLFDQELFTQQMVEQLYVVVGGVILDRDGSTIKKWILKNVSLTGDPCDKTLPKLKANKRDNCCEYTGPPFEFCCYCGRRASL